MSVPLDLSLISQLLTEQQTQGDLNALTKPGFFYVTDPTNTPNENEAWCHVINLVNYCHNDHIADNLRIFQIYINDHMDDNTVWYRQYSDGAIGGSGGDVGWTAWERFVTATDLQNSMSTKVNNSDLVADYYNKTDVDALINTINNQLNQKVDGHGISDDTVPAEIYDTTGTAHSESTRSNPLFYVADNLSSLTVGKRKLHFTLRGDDYPDNAKLAKISFSHSLFDLIHSIFKVDICQIVPAMLTIKFTDSSPIVATLDTDNSDTENFIYNVPTKLQNMTIGKGTEFDVYFLQ